MFLVVGLVAGVLAACSGNSGSGGDESSGDEGGEPSGEITVWGWNVAAESMELAVDGFKEQYPDVEVKVEDIGRLDVYEKLTVGLASGGNGLPDVVMVESDRLANYYDQFLMPLLTFQNLGMMTIRISSVNIRNLLLRMPTENFRGSVGCWTDRRFLSYRHLWGSRSKSRRY